VNGLTFGKRLLGGLFLPVTGAVGAVLRSGLRCRSPLAVRIPRVVPQAAGGPPVPIQEAPLNATSPSGASSLQLSRRTALKTIAALAAVPAAGTLAGCGGSSQTSSSSGGSSDKAAALSFVYLGTAEQQAQWNQLFAQFNKQHPNIKLKPEAVASTNWAEFFNKLSTRIAGGRVPDMVQVATEGQRLFASKGLLHPIDEFIAKDKAVIDEYYADLNPNLIKWNTKYASPGGKTYYLPGEFNTMVMHCNKVLFDKAGVPLPSANWTWDQFLDVCRQIKAKTGAFAYVAGTGYFTDVMPWLLTNGTSSFNADWTQPTFDNPQVQESAQFMRTLVEEKLSPPPGGTFDPFTALAQDKLAMFGGGRWPVINLRKLNAVQKTVIVPFPTKVGKGSPVGWNGYPILKASKNKEACWTFIKFLISKEGTSFFANLGGTIVPARRSVASSQAFLANSPKGTEYLYDALSYATPIPAPDKGAAIQQVIEDTWRQMLTGNTPIAQGTTQAQGKLQGLV
jgi:multiple sugar transport system substrate-binding protein